LEGPLKIPEKLFTPECKDLIEKLLKREPLKRLGAINGFDEVR